MKGLLVYLLDLTQRAKCQHRLLVVNRYKKKRHVQQTRIRNLASAGSELFLYYLHSRNAQGGPRKGKVR